MRTAILLAWVWLTAGFALAAMADINSWNQGRCGIGNDGVIAITLGWPVMLPGAVLAIATGHRYSDEAVRRFTERSCA